MLILKLLFPNKPWLFKKQITDAEFGLMWFNKDRNPLFNHYQAHFTFKPTNSEIDAFFTSDLDGIDPKQRHFYWEIEKKYFEIIPTLISSLEDFYERKRNQSIKIRDFENEFKLFAISISRYAYQKQEWSLSYTNVSDVLSGITISFKNWDAVDVQG
jgi:hypothetical protein